MTALLHAAVLIYPRTGGVAVVVVCVCVYFEMLAESAALDEDAVALNERNN